jgi:hypothetical protein
MSGWPWCGKLLAMDQVDVVGELVRYVCAFYKEAITHDHDYVHITLDWPLSGESQGLGAHGRCLRSAVHPSIPLAEE